MILRSKRETLTDCKGSSLEKISKKVRRKRQVDGTAQYHSQNKRIRRLEVQSRPLKEKPNLETILSHSSDLQTCGYFHPGQFQGRNRMTRMKETNFIDSISLILGNKCKRNASGDKEFWSVLDEGPPYRSAKYPDGSSSVFYSVTKPTIILKNYLTRFIQYLNVSRSVFIVGLIYLDRISKEDELLGLRELNVHRLVTSSFCLAAKYLEDEAHRNSSLSKIGGVPTIEEMNTLEVQFLRRLNWNCTVPVELYESYEDDFMQTSHRLLRHIAGELPTRQQVRHY